MALRPLIHPRTTHSLKRGGGIALVGVLWMMALLSVLASGLSQLGRSDAQLARAQWQHTQSHYFAEAGVQLALLNLLELDPYQRWLGDGQWYEILLDDNLIRIQVQDDSGKLNLNRASVTLLSQLIQAVGGSSQQGDNIAAAILDWRDGDSLRHLHGAEQADYQAAGLDYQVRNASFKSVEELQRVLGMNAELYRQLAPLLTVNSRSSKINPQLASREILLALSSASEGSIDSYITARRDNHRMGLAPPPPPGIDRNNLSTRKGLNYTIISNMSLNNSLLNDTALDSNTEESGISVQLAVAVEIKRKYRDKPVDILSWHQVAIDTAL